MNRALNLVACAIAALVLANPAAGEEKKSRADGQWPAWRGPLATGAAPRADPPTEWSEEKNIRWKVAIPGRGHATPIIWGDRIYIQTAVETSKDVPATPADQPTGSAVLPPAQESGDRSQNPVFCLLSSVSCLLSPVFGLRSQVSSLKPFFGGQSSSFAVPRAFDSQPGGDRARRGPGRSSGSGGDRSPPKNVFEFQVLALDRETGKTIWTTTVKEERPHESGHNDSSQASNSPVTDGKNIYSYFGSRGLHCLKLDGKIKWSVDLGQMHTRHEFGEGSSPVLYGNTIIVNWDHEGDDFIVAFDKGSGKQRWKVARDEHTTWSTPLVVEADGKPQVVVTATNHIRAYDLDTGNEVWRCKGMTENVIPSPMAGGGLLYAISGFRGAALLAIRYEDAHDDITDSSAVAWKYNKDTPYVPSGLLFGGRVYFLDNNRPLLSCLDAKSGKPLYEKQRLSGIDSIYASLVGAAGKVYIVGRNGTMLVLKDATKLEVLATNKLDDGFDASPAIVGNELYLRGHEHLYCIAGK